MNKKIAMSRVISECKRLLSHEIEHKELAKFIKDEVIATDYLSLDAKDLFMRKFNLDMSLTEFDGLSAVGYTVAYNTRLMFDGLMLYTNVAVENEEKTNENYDILCESKFFYFVESECKNDFALLKEMLAQTIGVNDLIVVKEIMLSFNTNELASAMKQLKNVLKDKKTVDNMAKLMDFNDPQYSKMIDDIRAVNK